MPSQEEKSRCRRRLSFSGTRRRETLKICPAIVQGKTQNLPMRCMQKRACTSAASKVLHLVWLTRVCTVFLFFDNDISTLFLTLTKPMQPKFPGGRW